MIVRAYAYLYARARARIVVLQSPIGAAREEQLHLALIGRCA